MALHPEPVAVVTGASRGIGKAAAVALAHVGFDVAIAARTVREGEGRDDSDTGQGRALPGSLAATAEEVEAAGRRALAVRMDLLDRASLIDGIDEVLEQWGRIDVLVNNAVHTGPGSMELFVDLDLETIETKLEANVVAQLVLIKQVLPGMLERGRGVIINVTSAVATSDPPAPAGQGGWGLGYAITKGALHRVAGILAVELGPQGILAYNVEPGFVVTERMTVNQRALGFEGRYRGAPPSVPGAVIAWLAAGAVADRPDADAGRADTSRADADDGLVPNGTTVAAQKIALERGLHPDWRITPAGA